LKPAGRSQARGPLLNRSKTCVVDFSISGLRLTHELDRISERRPLPDRIVCDNELFASSFCSVRASAYLHDSRMHKYLFHGQATVLPS